MAHCPFYRGPICSLCCGLELHCHDHCKRSTPAGAAPGGAPVLAAARGGLDPQVLRRVGRFMGLLSVAAALLGAAFLLTYRFMDLHDVAAHTDLVNILLRLYVATLVVASLGTWWMVLSHESQEQSERELLGSMRHLEDTRKSLVESEKLASLGGLVAGVAHEINTPVGISVSTASFLSDRTRIAREQSQAGQFDPAAQARYLQEAEASAKLLLSNATRVAELVLNFKQLAVDRIAESRRRFDLRSQIEATIAALRPRLDDARVQVDLDPGEAITMESYPVSLAQVVTNLVVNALQHAFVPGHGGHIRIHASLRDRDEVTLELTDDGRGIDPGLHAKVFEPFFTTNRQLGGSGLGLYIVNQVVTRQLGGSITLESRPGEGSRFVLCIPRATRHAPDVVRILAEPPRRSPDAA